MKSYRAGETEGLLEPDVERGDGEQAGDRPSRPCVRRSSAAAGRSEARPAAGPAKRANRVRRARSAGRTPAPVRRQATGTRSRIRSGTIRTARPTAIAAAAVATIPSAKSSSRRAANATAIAITSQPAAIRSAGSRSQAAAPASRAAVAPATSRPSSFGDVLRGLAAVQPEQSRRTGREREHQAAPGRPLEQLRLRRAKDQGRPGQPRSRRSPSTRSGPATARARCRRGRR